MKNNELLVASLAQLEREGSVSIPQLARLLDCTEEQLFDALEILVFAYDAASIRLDLHDTYATLASNHHIQLLRLTPHEAEVLIDALGQVGLSSQDELVQKLLETKGVLDGSGNTPPERMQTIGNGIQASVAQTLAAACEDEEHHLVQIAYRGEDDEEARMRTIEPVTFFSRDGRRYLQAFCHQAQDWRSFRLDRVKEATVLEEQYTPRKDTPPADGDFMRDAIKARVRFLPNVPLPTWPSIRTGKPEEDGSVVAHIDWIGSAWLPKHIVAYTGRAIPLDPPELVEACRDFANSLESD